MVGIIEYGVGNLFSLKSSLDKIGVDTVITSDKNVLKQADRLILPGVGAMSEAVDKLHKSELFDFIIESAGEGKPILGICLGMQLLFEKSYEYGIHSCLGLIKGEVRSIADYIPENLKIPHIGWNSLAFKKTSKLFKYINDGDYVYFVHSFCGVKCEESVSAVTDYGTMLTASVEQANVYGCQFHPEKSGETGLNILKAFCQL